MASRVKEDEKNEKIIRGLLKLPENRRCINCNGLGPQYVCTNFWMFVCTNCSGIHREFTHRVKSISMAKFTSQEVTALQEGGNKLARDIYLKEWDPQRQSAPDGSNVERLRNFIKHVYVDKRYTGEKNYGKPPIIKLGDKEDSYQGGSRSPPYEDAYECRYNGMSSPGGRSDDRNSRYGYDEKRSPGYNQGSQQYNDYRRSPSHSDIVNDWSREERFGNGKGSDGRRGSDGDSTAESRSPERLKDPEASSPPVVRPVREILGDNVVPLRISEPPKANAARVADGFAQTQRTASSSILGSTNGNPTELKEDNAVSLIDFDADPEPPSVNTAVPQVLQTTVSQSTEQQASTANDHNWASFDFASEVKVSQASPNANPLESVLSQLSMTAPVRSQISGMPSGSATPLVASGNATNLPSATVSHVVAAGNSSLLPLNTGASPLPPYTMSTFHPGGVSGATPGLVLAMPVNGGNSFVKVNEAGQWPGIQQQQQFQSTAQQYGPPFDGASGNQPWNTSVAPNMPASSTSSVGPNPLVPTLAPGVASADLSQHPAVEVKSSASKELPADLFTSTYSSFPAAVPGWQTGPPRGLGFAMQFSNAALPMPPFVQSSKSMNPFDLSESSPARVLQFPSMASLQTALPNMLPSSGLQHTSSLGTPASAWMPSMSLPYPSALPSQPPFYASGAHMAPEVASNMPVSVQQGVGGFSTDGAAFGTINANQPLAGRFSATPSPFSSVGGNPFG